MDKVYYMVVFFHIIDYGSHLENQTIPWVAGNSFYHTYPTKGVRKVRGLLILANSLFKLSPLFRI